MNENVNWQSELNEIVNVIFESEFNQKPLKIDSRKINSMKIVFKKVIMISKKTQKMNSMKM